MDYKYTEDDLKNEIWKDVSGYEDRYMVSNIGRVKSKDIEIKKKDGKTEKRKGRILSFGKNNFGYFNVCLSVNGNIKRIPVHRLVALNFIENPLKKPCVDHINTIRTDNRVSNLRWVTYSENNLNEITRTRYRKVGMFHHSLETKIKIGLSQLGRKASLETIEKLRSHAIPVLQYTKDGVFLKEYISSRIAAMQFRSNMRTHILACCNGSRKSAGGYLWLYKNGDVVKQLSDETLIKYKRNPSRKAGYKVPKDVIAKMSESKKDVGIPILQYNKDGVFVAEYPSMSTAARVLNCDDSCISRCCNGKMKYFKGYIWKKKNAHSEA